MWRSVGTGSGPPPKAEKQVPSALVRDRLAALAAFVTLVALGAGFFLSKDTRFLMPGPLASAHSAIESCSACHARSGGGKLSWIQGLVAHDPLADSKACLTCHKMPDTAFNAHGAAEDALKQRTGRLIKVAASTPAPPSARAQHVAFPTDDMAARGLNCATCHQEHQGANFNLSKISNEQCRACHVVKFDSFDGHHPKFDAYPFKRRTRIIYDHAGHFGKHYPEVAEKDPAKRIPETCSTCHSSREDKRVMAVAPFEKTCTSCHLDQIVGKGRASGPKGIAFLTVPGLDVQTLRKKNAPIGEWPDESDADLAPFMKVMISRNEQGRALIKTVDGLNLQDLTKASDEQIKAVTDLVWEIKGLFHALISGKASDVLGDLNIVGGAKLSASLVADLTASIPRDVVIGAHRQWLPNLGTEMASRQSGGSPAKTSAGEGAAVRPETDSADAAAGDGEETLSAARPSEDPEPGGSDLPEDSSGSDADPAAVVGTETASKKAKQDPQACLVSILGQCVLSKGSQGESSAEELPRPMQAGLREVAQAAGAEGAVRNDEAANATPSAGGNTRVANAQAENRASNQNDDLLFPTEDEIRAMEAGQPGGAARKTDTDAASKAEPNAPADAPSGSDTAAAAPVISIASDVDPESWAEYGGWYRQDYAIFYRPTGHKDKFIYSWLFLTGPQAPKGDTSAAAAVFDFLTDKDAQGSCTKCHSVDDIAGKGRVVNFTPRSVADKQGRFTTFVHEPHFGLMDDRGCLTCHALEKGRPYLKSYEQGTPQSFESSFGAVKKDLCQSCHTQGMARQDCLLCHTYHVNDVITPIINTRLPTR